MTELIGVGSFIKDHFHNRPHQETIIASTAHNIGPLCQLFKFVLKKLTGCHSRTSFLRLCFNFLIYRLIIENEIVLIGVMSHVLAHPMELCRNLLICKGLGWFKLVHGLMMNVCAVVEKQLF